MNSAAASSSSDESAESPYRYRMDHKRRGHFIIINNKKFMPHTGMNERSGTDQDATNLYSDFKRLGFNVEIYQDQTADQMLKIMQYGFCISFHACDMSHLV